MTNKVLGFEKKEADFIEGYYIRTKKTIYKKGILKGTRRAIIYPVSKTKDDKWQINVSKLVPVVSLKWLEKICKEYEEEDGTLCISVSSLLSAAKKEARK